MATLLYPQPVLTDEQIIAAYREPWLSRKIADNPSLDSCCKWHDWQAEKPQIEAIEEAE